VQSSAINRSAISSVSNRAETASSLGKSGQANLTTSKIFSKNEKSDSKNKNSDEENSKVEKKDPNKTTAKKTDEKQDAKDAVSRFDKVKGKEYPNDAKTVAEKFGYKLPGQQSGQANKDAAANSPAGSTAKTADDASKSSGAGNSAGGSGSSGAAGGRGPLAFNPGHHHHHHQPPSSGPQPGPSPQPGPRPQPGPGSGPNPQPAPGPRPGPTPGPNPNPGGPRPDPAPHHHTRQEVMNLALNGNIPRAEFRATSQADAQRISEFATRNNIGVSVDGNNVTIKMNGNTTANQLNDFAKGLQAVREGGGLAGVNLTVTGGMENQHIVQDYFAGRGGNVTGSCNVPKPGEEGSCQVAVNYDNNKALEKPPEPPRIPNNRDNQENDIRNA